MWQTMLDDAIMDFFCMDDTFARRTVHQDIDMCSMYDNSQKAKLLS
jgi:hypothetical protein